MTAPEEIDKDLPSPWKQAIAKAYQGGREEGVGTGFLVGFLFTSFVWGLGLTIYFMVT